jgi:flagellar assembly factor FliW
MSLPLATPSSSSLHIRSDLLGELDATSADVVHFEQGLYGFPDCRNFVLVASDRDGACWLQSADYTALTFLLVDPFVFFPGYRVDLPPAELARLDVQSREEVVVLAIVTMPAGEHDPFTANLQGPVILNTRTRGALQCVVGDAYGVREPFALAAGSAAGA